MGLIQYVVETGMQLGAYAIQRMVMEKAAPAPKDVDYVGQYLEGHAKALENYEAALRERAAPASIHPNSLQSHSVSTPNRPGCTAADEAIVALGHLEGLARGNDGFGVLRVSKERLEKAADAAEGLKHPEIAADMRAVAEKMPDVHDPAEALALADELRPVVDSAWDLGRRCKAAGAMTPADIARIRALAQQMAQDKE